MMKFSFESFYTEEYYLEYKLMVNDKSTGFREYWICQSYVTGLYYSRGLNKSEYKNLEEIKYDLIHKYGKENNLLY